MKPIKSKEPKPLALILTAISGVSLGVIMAGYLLLMKPVVPVSGIPDEALLSKPGNYNTYFSKGRTSGIETPNARNGVSRIQRRSPGPVSFGEDEINYFFKQIPKGQAKGEGEVAAASSIEQFNVRIVGDQMFASFKLITDPKGKNRFEMLVKANIAFENADTGPELVVSDFRINSLPIPGLGGLLTSMISSQVEGMGLPEDLVDMWANIRRIELESDKLIIDVGLKRT